MVARFERLPRVAPAHSTAHSIATPSLSVVRAHIEALAAAVVGPIPVGAK